MNVDKTRRFIEATELTQFIINNPQESWKIFSATAKELQSKLNKRAWQILPRFACVRPPLMRGYHRFQNFLINLV